MNFIRCSCIFSHILQISRTGRAAEIFQFDNFVNSAVGQIKFFFFLHFRKLAFQGGGKQVNT
jgi:hypothetical protein